MNDSDPMTSADRRVAEIMTALDPDARQVARMEAAVLQAWAADRHSFIAEWIDLLRVRPVVHGCYALGAAAVLLLLTPLGAIPLMLLREAGK